MVRQAEDTVLGFGGSVSVKPCRNKDGNKDVRCYKNKTTI